MTGTIIENVSGRKLSVLVAFLLLCQLTCFLIGGLAPSPANAQNILGTACKETGEMNETTWLYNRGNGACKTVNLWLHQNHSGTDIVFAFQLPIPRENMVLDYSRWQHNLIGLLQFDIRYNSQMEVKRRSVVTIDARIAYKNKGDPDNGWKLHTKSVEKRNLDCDIVDKSEDYLYCSAVPLFELGFLFHDFYLLNIRLDTNDMNEHVVNVQDMWLTVINQNGGFTKLRLSLKTIFFPCIIAVLIWFWRRIHMERKPVLLERMLISLGIALCLLNMPLEYLTLHFDLPIMLWLGDIRQGIFYAMLFSFWLVFAGEHMLIQDLSAQSFLKKYWRHLSAVAVGYVSLLVFDMCVRGFQLRNPFYSIWVTDIGANLAWTFIVLAGISTGIYFFYLCYMIWQVFTNISQKRQSLPTTSSRRLHYEDYERITYRYQFLMLATLICAASTVVQFILRLVAVGQWKWDENIDLEHTSAWFTGIYGMWNCSV